MNAARAIKWVGLIAGAAFGYLGWGLMKIPATETMGTVLFLFPSLILGGRGTTDAQAVLFTTVLYALVGFFLGWVVGRMFGSGKR